MAGDGGMIVGALRPRIAAAPGAFGVDGTGIDGLLQ